MFVDYCVNCGNKDVKQFAGDIHAFVLDRMRGTLKDPNGPRLTKCGSIYCPVCEYTGSAIRFSQEEEKRFYSEYGEKSYIDQRCLYEGQHMANIFNTYNDPRYIKSRQETLSKFLDTFVDISTIDSVLDFGGGNGQLIPEEFSHASKYVLDFSNKIPKPGVVAVKDASECPQVDLLISAHTLEHVSFPAEFLKYMKTFIKRNGLIYIEIPNEHNPNNAHTYHDWHEHIQNFSFNSLYALLTSHNINIIGRGNINLITGDTAIAVLGQIT